MLASDSRTHAGVDQVSIYSKMHAFGGDGNWMITLLSAGNLATTQAVVRHLRRDIEQDAGRHLGKLQRLAEAAEYVGEISVAEQARRAQVAEESFKPGASFIVAGQYQNQPHQIFLVYPEGNYIRASLQNPFLQIGESKYGKPILDRIIEPGVDLEIAARSAMVSMDSTMRSNLSVGPPIELQIYRTGSFTTGEHFEFEENNAYLVELRQAWERELKQSFARLPRLPVQSSRMRLVD